jgi:hypothetical protein
MMAESEKDRIAGHVADLRITFDMALSNQRKYRVAEFKEFVQSARRYIEITAGDPMIHKSVSAGSAWICGSSWNGTKDACSGPEGYRINRQIAAHACRGVGSKWRLSM